MCYVKRIVWSCGCIKGAVVEHRCNKVGTIDCRFRHLLERLRVPIPCQLCSSPDSTPSPIRRRHRHHRRRSVGVRPVAFIIRRRSCSGSSAGSGFGTGGSCMANRSSH
ncbi:hypothetical protein N657DRAFT_685341 [Parathielavia appendiculata]|uniref:Uncharacterized protein n=1 Tax=Parathielavia appendiculata TaxID=2587402 RepID=A0AAN6TPK3_9PEZI|nr:hypothetical protein N657DRAFT_685341 [Parathielavia appendiculata]